MKEIIDSWKFYITLTVIVILGYLFNGCNNINVAENITIKDIHRINSTLCIIDIYGNSSPDDFGKRTKISFSFTDTCAKYVVGDTLFLKFVNKINK